MDRRRLRDGERVEERRALERQPDPAKRVVAVVGRERVEVAPPIRTRPARGRRRPTTQRSSVLFPEPLPPHTTTTSPADAVSDTSSRTVRSS
jgi:hypothetical protein